MSIRNPDQRVGVFIDVQNLYYSARAMYQSRVNFNEILKEAVGGRRLIRAIEESAKEIRKNVEDLGKHLAAYEEYYKKVGSALTTTVNHYNTAGKELKKIDKDVMRISGTTMGIDPLLIEKPNLEE
jgi:DNA recombination protein RmuC